MVADAYFDEAGQWQAPLLELRRIVLGCGLKEALKWRQPCYTDAGRNVVILGGMKHHCVLSFFKGALLDDPKGLLKQNGPNTRSAKVMRFTSAEQVRAHEADIRALVAGAIAATRAGLKVPPRNEAPQCVEELLKHFEANPAFKAAFEALTPGRQRGYNLHFGAAKQSATRTQRIVRCTPRIMDGKGLNDCICGLSKRPPGCDGSHRVLST